MHSVIIRYKLLYRRWLPIIPVIFSWRGASLKSEAYLDSGAFYSIFKMSVAAELGLDISQAKKRMFVVADGLNLILGYTGLPAFGHMAFSCVGALTGRCEVCERWEGWITCAYKREELRAWSLSRRDKSTNSRMKSITQSL